MEFLRKKATNDQIEKLITAMERDPPMSNGYKGCPPEKKRRKEVVWDQLAKRLNAVPGGAIKDGHKWWKVWIDYRQNTKRKASKMLMQRSKNGESSLELSELEVRLLNMLGSEVVWGVDRALSTQLMSLPDHEYMAQSPETSRSDPQKVYPGKSQLSTSKPASVQISEPLPLFVTEKEEPIELESSDIENEEDRLQENIVQEVTIEEILAEPGMSADDIDLAIRKEELKCRQGEMELRSRELNYKLRELKYRRDELQFKREELIFKREMESSSVDFKKHLESVETAVDCMKRFLTDKT